MTVNYIAALRVVMPGRPVFARDEYQKIEINRISIYVSTKKIVGDREKNNRYENGKYHTYFNIKYITRMLSEEDLIGIRLIANDQYVVGGWNWMPDCVVYKIDQNKYKELLINIEELKTTQKKLIEPYIDYHNLEKNLDEIKTMMELKEPLIKVNKKLSKYKKIVQNEVDNHKKNLRKIQKDIERYFEKTLKIETVINF